VVGNQVREAACGLPLTESLIVLKCWFYFNGKRRRDTDNCHKVLGDTISKAIGIDDSRFLWRDMDIQIDKGNPRIKLEISPKELVDES
jgi:Holliday junction resolvase RusA-like endonuclease